MKTNDLEKIYELFWKNVYYNDAYIFYKNAIEYYKNIQNNKFYSFFSGTINKKLYTDRCQYIDESQRTDFSNNTEVKKIDIDDLCDLSVRVIISPPELMYTLPSFFLYGDVPREVLSDDLPSPEDTPDTLPDTHAV